MFTFVHNNIWYSPKRTFAFELPGYDDIDRFINNYIKFKQASISILMGESKVNSKDNYNKTIGRNIAMSRLALKHFKAKRLEMDSKEVTIEVEEEESKLNVKIIMNFENKRILIVRAEYASEFVY